LQSFIVHRSSFIVHRGLRLVGGLSVALMLSLQASPAKAQSYSTQQGSAGCSSAHCTPTLNDNANTAPSSGSSVSVPTFSSTSQSLGSLAGLGCTSNTAVVACTLTWQSSVATSDQSGLRVYNGDQTLLLNDKTLDSNAEYSAPIVFADSGVLAVDDVQMVYYRYSSGYTTSPTSSVYKSGQDPNNPGTYPDTGYPVSPVMVTSSANPGLVFIGTKCNYQSSTFPSVVTQTNDPCPISTFSLSSAGALTRVQSKPLMYTDGNGRNYFYETFNTPVVDQAHSRVYVVASEICKSCNTFLTPRQGRLFAIDVNSSGTMTISASWYLNFPGPSGASPMLITNYTSPVTGHTGNALFFDGLAYGSGTSGTGTNSPCYTETSSTSQPTVSLDTSQSVFGCFFGVLDSSSAVSSGGSSSAELMWDRAFQSQFFEANAVFDDRNSGSLWIFPIQITGGSGNGPTCMQTGQNMGWNPPNCLIRISAGSGQGSGSAYQLQGPLDLGSILGKGINCGDNTNGCPHQLPSVAAGNAGAFAPSSAVTMTKQLINSVNHYFLTVGAYSNATGTPSYVMTIDITSGGGLESLDWGVPLVKPDGSTWGLTAGQFAFVTGTNNVVSTVFTGLNFGPAFIQ